MKIFLTVLAFVGLAFVMLGTAGVDREVQLRLTAPKSAYLPGSMYFEWSGLFIIVCWVLASLGALLALTGGLIARPRYLWIPLIAIGIIYVLSMGMCSYLSKVPWGAGYQIDVINIALKLMLLLPGIVCIIGGLVLRKPKRRRVQIA